jgi:hypothetical protein
VYVEILKKVSSSYLFEMKQRTDGFKGWGKPGEEDGISVLDEHDPNYAEENTEENEDITENNEGEK